MTDIDRLIKEQLLTFREKVLGILKEKHPYVYSIANGVLSGRKNMAGLQVTENGQVIGEYTFHLNGVHIENVDIGRLESGINHPFLGLVKPYCVTEKNTIERIINDEGFSIDLLNTFTRYLPEITIKFL